MSASTSIQWTDATWNPIRGCSVVSEGCKNCYAMKVAARFSDPGMAYEGLALRSPARWTGEVRVIERHLLDPIRWQKPRRIFTNSMSDLFHESLPFDAIDRVFAVMALSQSHTFQVLTKRADQLAEYMASRSKRAQFWKDAVPTGYTLEWDGISLVPFPLPNVWLGVSVESPRWKSRIDTLRKVPAAVRFLSVEPQIDDLGDVDLSGIHWVIQGGESGAGARPFDVAWARRLRDQCDEQGVAYFLKQLGAHVIDTTGRTTPLYDRVPLVDSHGGEMAEWPDDLRVREFPKVPA